MRQLPGLIPLFLLFAMTGCGNKATPTTPESGSATSGTEGSVTVGEDTSSTSGTKAADASSDNSHDHPHPHEHPEPEKVAARENLNGNWLLSFPQFVPPRQEGQEFQANDNTVLLFNIDGADDESRDVEISIIAGRQALERASLSDTEISDGRIRFHVNNMNGEKVFEYSGQLKMGFVIGNCAFADGNVVMARLLPTNEKTFARIPASIPLPETQLFVQLGSSPVPDEDTRDFVELIPVSPLGRLAYLQVVRMTAAKNAPADELERVIGEFITVMKDWGELAALYSELEAFNAVCLTSYNVDWCLAKVDELKEKIEANETLQRHASQLTGLKKQLQYRQTTELLSSDEESDRQKAREQAAEFLQETPFEPILTVLMADDARENKRIDEAIRLYAELAALPMQEQTLRRFWSNEPVQKTLPSERVAKLWKEKNGSTEGLDEYLDKVYHDGISSIADAPFAPTPEDASKHTVLCELFTGARCPPCVAADVALDAIASTYPQSQVITLRYHVHVPGHDPLTNDDCEARFYNFYKPEGTPTLFIDGRKIEGAAGFMVNTPQAYQGLRGVIDELRGGIPADKKTDTDDEPADREADRTDDSVDTDKPSDTDKSSNEDKKAEDKPDANEDDDAVEPALPKLTIDLRASRQQDSIQVATSVKGLTPETSNVRLMLVLAESDIHFEAFNGIREHDMVVRQLIGGDRGISPKDQNLEYQGTVNVEELRDRLHSYLTNFEENQGVEFASMPLELNNLSVVAFVQDVETRRVLQSVVVPVSGAVAAE